MVGERTSGKSVNHGQLTVTQAPRLSQLKADRDQLQALIEREQLQCDEQLAGQLAMIDIALAALAMTESRARQAPELLPLLTIKSVLLGESLTQLAFSSLGYLALLEELPGTNEPLRVPPAFRKLCQQYLDTQRTADNADEVARARQLLVDTLLGDATDK